MKNSITRIALTAATLLLAASMAFAIEVKTPDTKGAVKATAGKSKADSKADAKGRIVDINSATEAELKSVPGIDDNYAAKIIAGRPYASKAQLKSRNIMPAPAYEKIKDLIIAKKLKK
jgi:competence protein ComEA